MPQLVYIAIYSIVAQLECDVFIYPILRTEGEWRGIGDDALAVWMCNMTEKEYL